jgi:hypothetical protein
MKYCFQIWSVNISRVPIFGNYISLLNFRMVNFLTGSYEKIVNNEMYDGVTLYPFILLYCLPTHSQ